jgi:hypothetical protein
MTTATNSAKPAWDAKVTRKEIEITQQFVDLSHPGGAEFRFRVDRRKGGPLTVIDYREPGTWRTLPPERAGKARRLTLNAFRLELAALVGFDRANEIVRSLRT